MSNHKQPPSPRHVQKEQDRPQAEQEQGKPNYTPCGPHLTHDGPRDYRKGDRWLPWHFNADGTPKEVV